jgi:hypothetical protein
MTNKESSDWTISFGNGTTSTISEKGHIGNLKEVSICPDIVVPVISVSQIADQLDCPVIFTSHQAYVLRPNAVVQFRQSDVMIMTDQVNGLYPLDTQ